MTVYARACRAHGVVDVHAAQIAEAHNAVEVGPRTLVAFACKFISGSARMAGVYAHANAAFVVHTVDYMGKMLETVAERRTLACGVLYHCSHTLGAFESIIYRLSHPRKTLVFADLPEVRAWVEVQPVDAEGAASSQLVDECYPGEMQLASVGRAEVDHKCRVRQNMARPEAVCTTQATEALYVFLGVLRSAPSLRGGQIERKGVSAQGMSLLGSRPYSRSSVYMCAYIFHLLSTHFG